ncbi:MAG: RNA-binding protein 42, partial [Candelina submexicana]
NAFTATPSFASGAPGTAGYAGGGGRGGDNQPSNGYGGAFTPFRPRSVAGQNDWHDHSATVSAPPVPASPFSAQQQQTNYSASGYQPQQAYSQPQPPQFYHQASEPLIQPTPPQIRNPFPLPGQELSAGLGRGRGVGGTRFQESGLDPELEAQIAQWQSAYAGKDAADQGSRGGGRTTSRFNNGGEGPGSASGANNAPLGNRGDASHAQQPAMSSSDMASAVNADTGVAAVVNGADGKQKTVVRSGGGQTWQDQSLLEWDPAHFRIFVGNLAGEVTDESLLKAFSRYPSVQKARVVRDKRTTKSKGYGFVSFSDGEEYFQAARDMQGKYIGSHPVLLKKSTTEIRPTVPGDKRGGKYGKGGKGGGKDGGAKTGAGVQKKQSKTKGGLRVLG